MLSGKINALIQINQATAQDLGQRAAEALLTFSRELSEGSAAGQFNKVFADTRTLAASANEDLDLNGSSLQDMLGVNLALTGVKLLGIKAADTNTNDVILKPGATNGALLGMGAAAHTIAIPPGQILLRTNMSAAGWTVTPATADLINVANGGAGTAVSYSIVVAGI